jgi:hypothetical protein
MPREAPAVAGPATVTATVAATVTEAVTVTVTAPATEAVTVTVTATATAIVTVSVAATVTVTVAAVLAVCAVQPDGASYGLRTGDRGTGPALAIIPGDHEVGVFFDLRAGYAPSLGDLTTGARLKAWAAPVNVLSRGDCCAEEHEEGRLAPRVVAARPSGFLVSLGTFDRASTQVALQVDVDDLFPSCTPQNGHACPTNWGERFYVNGEPAGAP